MAHLSSNFILLWPLFISCLYVQIISNMAEFPRIEHPMTEHEFPRIEHPLSKHPMNKNGESVSFLVVGDWGRGGNFNQSKVATQMGDIANKSGIDFVISTGDNFYPNGLKGVNDPAFQRSFTNIYTAKSLQTPWYAVLGNHDYMGNAEAQLSPVLRKLDSRWHCMRNFIVGAGFLEIVFIDTTPFVDRYFVNLKKKTFDWRDVMPRDKYMSYVSKNLDLTLKKSKSPWRIVVGHHTIKSIGRHGDTQEIVDQILPILEENKVDMYINGHDHCLEHICNKEGRMQFLTSGGGSKAWANDIHYGMHNGSTHFYHDGQGFMHVKLTHQIANITFYDVSGNLLYILEIGS